MRAAQLVGPRRWEFMETDMPSPKPGEVLVRMEYVSICGSDLRTYDRVLPEHEYPLKPGAPCHECVGIVEESLDDRFKKGQRIIALQAGGVLEYASIPARNAIPVPSNDLDPAMWVLCQPIGTVLYAVNQMGSVLGKRVVILGQGPIGLAFTDFVARAGARQVIVSDLHDYRLETAKRLGATHTIHAARQNVTEAITEITKGEMADVAVEATGRPETCHQVFEALRMHGTAIIFGIAHDVDVFPFDWTAMYSKLPHMIVTNSARSGDMPDTVDAMVDLVSQGRFDLSPYLTHTLPWTDLSNAFEIYSHKREDSLKVVMNVTG